MNLLIDLRVVLAEDMPPLAVAEDDVFHSQIAEHGGAGFTCERPVRLVIYVLRAQCQAAAVNCLAHGVQVASRRADGQVDSTEAIRLWATTSASATAALRSRFIFQLPAMNLRRIKHLPI